MHRGGGGKGDDALRQLVAAGAIVVAAATVAVAVAVNDPDQTPAPGTLGGAPRAAAAAAGPQPPSPASLAAEDRLRTAAGGRLTITRGPNGLARLVGTTPGHSVALPGGVSPAAPAPVQALAHLAPIGALSALSVTAGPKKITVSWKQPLYTGGDGYFFLRLLRVGAYTCAAVGFLPDSAKPRPTP